MEEYVLTRTGRPPLAFRGELIAEVDGYRSGDKEQTRWHDLAAYRTEAGSYVVAITFRSKWQGEVDHHHVHHAATAREVFERIAEYDPLAHFEGYPPGEAYREKTRRLNESIIRRFQAGISELFEGMPSDAFAERIA